MTPSSTTGTVGSGDATVTYDVHGDVSLATAERPVLMLVASPMEAAAFTTLRSHFTDRPVVTYDPRGAGRNPRATDEVRPEDHAGDLHAVIAAVGAGPVDLFATSGGAVNALALVAEHPDDVRTLVAHEPPVATLLPDRDAVLAVCQDIRDTYDRAGHGAAMAKFIAVVMHDGPLADDHLDRPAPDPAAFGMSADDDGTRTEPLMRNMPSCTQLEPDVDALRALGDRLVVAAGTASRDELAARGARSVAEAVGIPVTAFPSHHAGFLGGEQGQHGEPEAFAARLREVLDDGVRG